MTTLYKLTDADGYTRREHSNAMLWGANVTHTATGDGTELCTGDVIHAYVDPLLAVLLNPIHANLKSPVLWEAEGEIVAREGQIKVGVKTLTTIRRLPVPEVTTEQCVRFAIYCAQAVIGDTCPEWSEWTNKWLAGEDRSAWAAEASALAAEEAAWAAALAAEASALAARAAALAAEEAAWAAALAAEASAEAAALAALAVDDLDVVALSRLAMEPLK